MKNKKLNKKLKTPLRYPGGKSRMLNVLDEHLPDMSKISNYYEPFLGGGSVALHMTKYYELDNIYVNDLYKPLYAFWKILQTDVVELVEHMYDLRNSINDNLDVAEDIFDLYVASLNNLPAFNLNDSEDLFDLASMYYYLNRISFSGLSKVSSFSTGNYGIKFAPRFFEQLRFYSEVIKDWKITNYSYNFIKPIDKNDLIYLDPPYNIHTTVYKLHAEFNHDSFWKYCEKLAKTTNVLISYDASILERDLSNWNVFSLDHTYTLSNGSKKYEKEQKDRKEIILRNY